MESYTDAKMRGGNPHICYSSLVSEYIVTWGKLNQFFLFLFGAYKSQNNPFKDYFTSA